MSKIESIRSHFRSFIRRGFRVGKLSVVLAVGSSSRLAIEKLLVVPLILHVLNPEGMGLLLLLLGWVQMLGFFPAVGASDGLLKLHTQAKEEGVWNSLVLTAMVFAGLTTATSLILFGIGYSIFKPISLTMGGTTAALGIYMLLLVIRQLLLVSFRVELRFGTMALVEIISGVLILLALPGAWLGGTIGAAAGYAASALLLITTLLYLMRNRFRGARIVDKKWIWRFFKVAPTFALAGALGLAFHQAGRLVVGGLISYEAVTVFFAAESVIMLVLAPLTFFSVTIYTFVSRRSGFHDISRGAVLQHCISCIAACVMVYLIVRLAGHLILDTVYPSVAKQSWPLLKIMAIGSLGSPLFFLSRGFVYRFCRSRQILFYSILCFAVLLILLLISVPLWGLPGSAWAVAIANLFLGFLWFGTYVYLFVIRPRQEPEKNEPFPEAESLEKQPLGTD